jgi:DNA-binding MarR family transcriptional regulator
VQSTHSRTQELAGEVAALAESVGAFLSYAQKSSGEDFFRLVGELELSLSQLKLLMLLERDGEQQLAVVAEQLILSLPAASRAVDALHRRDLVVRREDEEDRRQKRVAITASGSEIVGRLSAARLAGIREFIETLTTQEQDDLAAALAPIVARDEVAACIPKRTPTK